MMWFVRHKYLFLFFVFFSGASLATDQLTDPRRALETMMRAMDTLNYQGTVAIVKNGKLETMKFAHAFKNGIGQERITALNSPLREIIRDTDKVLCVFKKTQKVIVDHRPIRRSFFLDLPETTAAVEANYQFSFAGEESIALLPAKIVLIRPKDNLRYTRKIWVDRNSHLPLRFELLDAAGVALEQVVFVDIQIKNSLPFVEVSVDEKSDTLHIQRLEKLPFSQSKFVVDQLPAGFDKVFFTHRTMRNPEILVEHLLLSDGFSSVSVYFEKGDDEILETRLTKAGAINSIERRIDNYRLTVMGEVPSNTVRLIADGVKLR